MSTAVAVTGWFLLGAVLVYEATRSWRAIDPDALSIREYERRRRALAPPIGDEVGR